MPSVLRQRIAWLFGYRQVPFAVRGIYRFEALHMTAWGATWGCLNASFGMYVAEQSMVAKHGMGVSVHALRDVLAVSTIAASTAIANVFAIWWGSMATRFDRKRLLLVSMLFVSLTMSSVAFTPWLKPPWTVWLFVVQMVAAWVGVQASNTLRTSLWRTNYPDRLRGRILGRFAIWQMHVGSLFVVTAGAYLDGALKLPLTDWRIDLSFLPGAARPDAYAKIFPVGALFALVSVALYSRVRVRGPQRAVPVKSAGALAFSDTVPGWISTWATGLRTGLAEAFDVLRHDPAYRRYMFWQMVAGSANMVMIVPFVRILAHRFDDVNYVTAAGLVALVPQVVILLTTAYWSRLFDHWSIGRFRSVQMIFWGGGATLIALGAWKISLLILTVGVAIRAFGEAAGRLAWQLGHMAYAPAHKDSLYMGVHQALTGLRGLSMPILGALLYEYVLDWHIVWVAAALQLISAIGFARLEQSNAPAPAPVRI
jgi:MFS family permease